MIRRFTPSLTAGIVPAIVLCCSFAVFGQTETPPTQVIAAPAAASVVVVTPPPPKTHLQALADLKGTLVVAGFTDVGTVQRDDGGYVRVTAAQFTNTATSEKQFGLLVFVHAADGGDREIRSYIDDDEIDGLLTSLDAMAKLDRTATQLSDFDARFRTRGDLEIANVNNNGIREVTFHGVEIFASSGQEIWAATHFPLARLAEVAQYLNTGKQLIDKAKEQVAQNEPQNEPQNVPAPAQR